MVRHTRNAVRPQDAGSQHARQDCGEQLAKAKIVSGEAGLRVTYEQINPEQELPHAIQNHVNTLGDADNTIVESVTPGDSALETVRHRDRGSPWFHAVAACACGTAQHRNPLSEAQHNSIAHNLTALRSFRQLNTLQHNATQHSCASVWIDAAFGSTVAERDLGGQESTILVSSSEMPVYQLN
ncbi:hypothetical protein V494_03481 [Pseudogymnoascus sp. VKM F-4513 (FW-928)]|nr:hypothetical protein V494_03481 [Pseudogymnoascus sp. VKM F-4513 (FW-928)]